MFMSKGGHVYYNIMLISSELLTTLLLIRSQMQLLTLDHALIWGRGGECAKHLYTSCGKQAVTTLLNSHPGISLQHIFFPPHYTTQGLWRASQFTVDNLLLDSNETRIVSFRDSHLHKHLPMDWSYSNKNSITHTTVLQKSTSFKGKEKLMRKKWRAG